ncbi:MAG: GNAT family N-acetyltransferase [Clostridiales bacterium]|nr:GNAT family N-acetyltransferase [Clostridiales bacterium]
MLRLRHYKSADAQTILSWCRDERSFRRWTSDRYDAFPVAPEDMNRKYAQCNGDCAEPDNFYPMTAFDEDGVAGHLILRYTDAARTCIRLGFVIVDDGKRGRGYGKELIRLALRYAFDLFGAQKVTLGVFEDNLPAYRCYQAAGFRRVEQVEPQVFRFGDEVWPIIEFEITKEEYAQS